MQLRSGRFVSLGLIAGTAVFLLTHTSVFADNYADQGMKLFKAKDYAKAAAYYEQSIKNVPWESSPYYYCALSYHYMRDFKKAKEKYALLVEKFPGTEASNNAIAALNQLDPEYMKKSAVIGGRTAPAASSGKGAVAAAMAAASQGQNNGTVEGQPQARVTFRKNQSDMVVDVRINGRTTRAIFDPNAEATIFSRQQLAALGIQAPKGATEFKGDVDLGGVVRKGAPITIDDSGQPAKIGQSFLEAFNYKVDETSKFIDIRRKGGAGAASSGAEISFTKDGKDIVVTAEINGRGTPMIYDPQGDALEMSSRSAKALGLRVDEAEEKKADPNEGPQRGDPNWVPPEDRPSGPKHLPVRLKFGPMEKVGVNCAISETGPKYPKFSAGAINDGSWTVDIDYRASKIRINKR